METKLRTLKDVATILGVKPYRINYVLAVKLVPEPENRFGNKRVFTEQDIQRLRDFFIRRASRSALSNTSSGMETAVFMSSV